ncbi:MAG: hypothetical protein ABFS39_19110 [Pseudomonadota bacterium]
MPAIRCEALHDFFERYENHPAAGDLRKYWLKLAAESTETEMSEDLITLYESVTAVLEDELWRIGCPDSTLELYQHLFREMESHIASGGDDTRFEFIVVIPVADRPQHLENCLNSLLELCQRYRYGGIYRKLSVLIADDSKEPGNISRHQETLESFAQQGFKTIYFGQTEQLRQLDRLSPEQKNDLYPIIGDNKPAVFYHKGASITRNITLLKLAKLAGENDRRLFWFMDSDQEFQVNTGSGDRNVYAINYFQRLNQIFSTTDALVLTGKVVGDPPVSPAVMAGNFLRDVMGFLSAMTQLNPQQMCQFHDQELRQEDEATYHDMANLFGFEPVNAAFHYHCSLTLPHDHRLCFADFSEKLNRFFDGEHPTRQTRYEHQEITSSIKPARTVYTGNYVFRASALEYFIPFAALKLRMAGPVLGRILKAEKGQQFISANLPMLHKRTVDRLGQSEFRPDIDRSEDLIDLSGEFERQFYGDVMLFSIEHLTTQGYPSERLPEQLVRQTLSEVEASMLQKYSDIHAQILKKLGDLKSLFGDRQNWWHQDLTNQPANANFLRFIRNMEHNFGDHSPAYRMIHSESHRQKRLQQVFEAIMRLPQDRISWSEALSAANKTTAQTHHKR